MSGLCLTAGSLLAAIPLSTFSLATIDNVDGSRQEVLWRIEGKQLVSGASPSRREDGSQLAVSTQLPRRVPRLLVTHAPGAPKKELCIDGRCRPLENLLPGIEATAVIELAPCP
ncbi:MAG: hypothetical protein BWY57_00444 [Betaproteobacteria bacterium ADurb.Bin341]|nr:MAG: hypothetical protein BWY57_00444 [Betaproteobacteria bacterium ADurb.Bin341]